MSGGRRAVDDLTDAVTNVGRHGLVLGEIGEQAGPGREPGSGRKASAYEGNASALLDLLHQVRRHGRIGCGAVRQGLRGGLAFGGHGAPYLEVAGLAIMAENTGRADVCRMVIECSAGYSTVCPLGILRKGP